MELLENLRNQVHNSNKESFRKVFLEYVFELIQQKEKGNLSVEQVGYEVVGASMSKELDNDLKLVFDLALEMEISRKTSYKQQIGEWDEKIANKIKEDEWKEFLIATKVAQFN